MCKGSWTDYNLKCKRENARSFVKLYAHPQPLRHCVPPPLAQGRLGEFTACHLPLQGSLGEFAPCYLPLHRGGWKILLRVTFPYTGETMERSVKSGHSPQISPRNLSSSILELFTASSMANASASAASAPTALMSAGTSPREKA